MECCGKCGECNCWSTCQFTDRLETWKKHTKKSLDIMATTNTKRMSIREYRTFKIFAERMLEVNIITKDEYSHLVSEIEEKWEQLYSPNLM